MESTIWFTDGFVVITGEIGSGKTTLIETFLKELDQDVVVAQINQTQVSPIEFLQGLLVQFGFSPFRMRKAELLATLNNFLIEQYANGRKVLLIVDEAQNLSNKVLEEVRLLSGVETTKDKVLRIILAGQPELNEKLDSPELVQLRSACACASTSARSSREMGRATSEHRLEVPAPATADLRSRHVRADLPLHRRHPAPDQHALRHRDAGGVRPGRRDGRPGNRAAGRWPSCSGRNTRARTHTHLPADAHRRDGAAAARRRVGRVVLSTEGRRDRSRAAGAGPLHRRAHAGQRPADRQQVRQPPPHAVRHHRDDCYVEDLNSTNGIFLNGKRVRRHKLQPGDIVKLGMHELAYTRADLPAARPTKPRVQPVPPTVSAVDAQRRLADADRDALPFLAAGADAVVELEVVADHRHARQHVGAVADQRGALDRRVIRPFSIR
jgi:general secretion pathway protein A